MSEKELVFSMRAEADGSVAEVIEKITEDLTALREMTKLTLTMTVDASVASSIQSINTQLDELHAKSEIKITSTGGDQDGGGGTWRTQTRTKGGRFGGRMKGFATGGYTGGGTDQDEAGVVHSNEFVMPADVVRSLGVGAMSAIVDNARGNDNSDLDGIMNTVRQGARQAENFVDRSLETLRGGAARPARGGRPTRPPRPARPAPLPSSGSADLDDISRTVRNAGTGRIRRLGNAQRSAGRRATRGVVNSIRGGIRTAVAGYAMERAETGLDWLAGEDKSKQKKTSEAEEARLSKLSEPDRYAQTNRDGQSKNLAYRNASENVANIRSTISNVAGGGMIGSTIGASAEFAAKPALLGYKALTMAGSHMDKLDSSITADSPDNVGGTVFSEIGNALTQTRLEGERFDKQEAMNKRGTDRLAGEKKYWEASNKKLGAAYQNEVGLMGQSFSAEQRARMAGSQGGDEKLAKIEGLISSKEESITQTKTRGKEIDSQQMAQNKETLQEGNTAKLAEEEKELGAMQKERLGYMKEIVDESRKEIIESNKKLELEDKLLEKKQRVLEREQKQNASSAEKFSEMGQTDQAGAVWAIEAAKRGENLSSADLKLADPLFEMSGFKNLKEEQTMMDMKAGNGSVADLMKMGAFGDTDKNLKDTVDKREGIEKTQKEGEDRIKSEAKNLDAEADKIADAMKVALNDLATIVAEKLKEASDETKNILNNNKNRQNGGIGGTGRSAQ